MKERGETLKKSGFSEKAKGKKTILPKALQMYGHSNSCKKREPKEADQTAEGSSSEEEHMENALALGADEGRDKLR